MLRLKPKEKDIVWSILQYLRAKKVFCWRNNTGGFAREGHFYRFGDRGSPDIFAVRDGKIYGIECKVKGESLTEGQTRWSWDFEQAGGVYLVVRSIDDVVAELGE